MNIIIQKFGGTSVASKEARVQVVGKIKQALAQGFKPVVTVSAMGRGGQPYATDTLLGLIDGSLKYSMAQNLDLLLGIGEVASAVVLADELAGEGIDAVVLNGAQAGIVTDHCFNQAKIIDLRPQGIIDQIKQGKLVIVAGFQGVTEDGRVTTLGRGGSDTTAAALGVALKAEMIEIYTDVAGIMTADPQMVAEAKILRTITYNELCHLAYQGAKVVHPRAVELAMSQQIPMRVRSTFSQDKGTLVIGDEGGGEMEERLITGIAYLNDMTQIKVKIAEAPLAEEKLLRIFTTFAEQEISVDFINIYPQEAVFTIKAPDTAKGIALLDELDVNYKVTQGCSKVSVVGANMTGVPGVMAHIMEALVKEGIEILQTSDSYTTIWCLVKSKDLKQAVQALHKQFKLS